MAGDSAPLGKLQLTRHDGRRMYQRPLPDIRDDEERISTAREALKCGFWSMLKDAFPERWTEWPEASDMKLLFEDIEKATGYVFEEVSFASSSTRLFHALRAKNFSTSPEEYAGPVVAWHGSSKAGVWGISERGFDEKRLRPGAFGNGVYVSPDAFVALLYAEPCKDGKLCVLFGNAHLGDLARIPVGSRGQTDFGRHADGADVLTLRNSAASYFCMKCENANDGQLLRRGVMVFSIDTSQPPSDFALCHMYYPPAVWAKFKQNVPGIVARRMRLQRSDDWQSQGTACDTGLVHVPDEALRLAVLMNKQHRRTREEQARQKLLNVTLSENANHVISKPEDDGD
jgi:hypothetical protein